jgi:hypothetical protein
MKPSAIVTLSLLCSLASACSSSSNGGGTGGATAGSSAAGSSAAGGGSAVAGSGGDTSALGGGAAIGLGGAASWVPSPMPLISRNVPAFASGSTNIATGPEKSNDNQPAQTWIPDKLPAWLAYDLSGVSADQRGQVLVAWYAPHAGAYIMDSTTASTMQQAPVDYTIDINAAAGGGMPPTDGWQNVATVTGNARNARQHLVGLNGANWVRMTVTKATDPLPAFDLDVHSAPDGASDSWLFMGDSITFISTGYAFDDIPSQANMIAPDRWPAVIDAAIGGTNTVTAQDTIDQALQDFPGRFVTLNYGTNNHASDYDPEPLIQKVQAAGKIPAIPHMPWSDSTSVQTEGPLINQAIDAIYQKHPEILHGPDFWAVFMNRPDLIPTGDVHPNGAGQAELRKQWAIAMTK